jgi:hypothetical protein
VGPDAVQFKLMPPVLIPTHLENALNMESDDETGDEPWNVFVIVGEVRRAGGEMFPFNALLMAPDDDTAVRMALEALAQEGYEEADLHQIGNIEERPDDPHFQPAYDSALEGEIAIISFEGGFDPGSDTLN